MVIDILGVIWAFFFLCLGYYCAVVYSFFLIHQKPVFISSHMFFMAFSFMAGSVYIRESQSTQSTASDMVYDQKACVYPVE